MPDPAERERAEFVAFLRNLANSVESRPFVVRVIVQENTLDVLGHEAGAIIPAVWPRTFIVQVGEELSQVNGPMADALIRKAVASVVSAGIG
jgi:hypothetical protein